MDLVSYDQSDNIRKIISLLALTTGMLIFCGVLLLKLDVWAHKQVTDVQMTADQLDFENLRYHRTALEVMQKKGL